MKKEIKNIRYWLVFLMVTLFLSGLMAIPLETELSFVISVLPPDTEIGKFISKVYESLHQTNIHFPF